MGACISMVGNANVYEDPKIKKYQTQFEALQLTPRDVGRLWAIYKEMDTDRGGSIGLAELLIHVDLEKTCFTEAVFSIFDEDGSGEVDFREFVISLWNYCTLSRATLDLFAFDLYDRDHSGLLNVAEVKSMLRDVYGSGYQTNAYARYIATQLDDMQDDGDIDCDKFCKFALTHQALLFPAFEMQRRLQKHTLGERFWQRISDIRIEMSSGTFVPVGKFMQLHLDPTQMMNHSISKTKPVDAAHDKAVMALAVTGTKNQRIENQEYRKAQEDEEGYGELKVKPKAPIQRSNSQQKLHTTAKGLGLVHLEISNHQGAVKVLNTAIHDDHHHVPIHGPGSHDPASSEAQTHHGKHKHKHHHNHSAVVPTASDDAHPAHHTSHQHHGTLHHAKTVPNNITHSTAHTNHHTNNHHHHIKHGKHDTEKNLLSPFVSPRSGFNSVVASPLTSPRTSAIAVAKGKSHSGHTTPHTQPQSGTNTPKRYH